MRARPLNVHEAASALGVAEETVRRMARRGAIPAYKVNDHSSPYRFRPEAITAWIASKEAANARRAS